MPKKESLLDTTPTSDERKCAVPANFKTTFSTIGAMVLMLTQGWREEPGLL
jgi:hypothetical protein